MTKNTILLQRRLVNFPQTGQDNLALAMSVQKELMIYGFMLDEKAFSQLKHADTADIVDFQSDVVAYLRDIMGAGNYVSLFGNFPHDKMSMTDSEVMFLQIIHYWTNRTFIPYHDGSAQRGTEYEQVEYKMIAACTEQEYKEIFPRLLSVGNSLTKADTETIKWFVANEKGLRYPDSIPFKENLAVIASLCPEFTVKTVVDVLRVAVGFSGGDVSLPAVPKLPKKPGPLMNTRLEERKKFKFRLTPVQQLRVMELFENSNLDTRDMKQGSRYGRFIRLAEVLKVQTYKDLYPKTFHAFYVLRNQKRKGKPDGVPVIRTWHSDVKKAFAQGYIPGITKLSERPGEYVRRLDYLIRTNPAPVAVEKTIDMLALMGDKISNKVLFEVFTHFSERNIAKTGRSIFIKGARSRVPLPDLRALSNTVVDTIQQSIFRILENKFSQLEPIGKCWIDPELKKIPLPTNMRSISESLVVVIRGQKTPININSKVIRAYVHWNGGRGATDLDISGTFVKENKTTFVLNYSRQYIGNSLHSGDVRNRPGLCAEYIDIDIEDAKKRGYRYVVFDVRDYNWYQGSSGMVGMDTRFGFEGRKFPLSNNTWLPSTSVNAMKITTSATGVIICIIDLNTLEYIWIDEDTAQRTAHNTNEVSEMIKQYATLPKVSVYDLLEMHVNARGKKSSEELATTHFLFKDFSESYVKTLELMGV